MVRIKCSTVPLLLCLFLLLNSCTSNNSASSPQDTTAAPEKPKYEVYTVEIKNMKFVPDSIVVKKGDEVVFVNRDMVDHCVTEEKSKAWTSGKLPADGSYLLVTKESCTYFCAIHMVMKGKIIVQ